MSAVRRNGSVARIDCRPPRRGGVDPDQCARPGPRDPEFHSAQHLRLDHHVGLCRSPSSPGDGMKLAIGVALCAVIALPSIAQPADGDIEKATLQFVLAVNRGDAAAVARIYTEDAVVMPPKADMVEGRQAILRYWRDVIAAGLNNLLLHSLRIDRYGADAA